MSYQVPHTLLRSTAGQERHHHLTVLLNCDIPTSGLTPLRSQDSCSSSTDHWGLPPKMNHDNSMGGEFFPFFFFFLVPLQIK